MRLLERRFVVSASVEKSWAHLAQVSNWPRWARHIRRIDLSPDGPLQLETSGVIRLTNGVRSTFRMKEINVLQNWRWTGPFLWLLVDYDHRFRAIAPNQCEIVFTIDGSGFGIGFFGRIFATIYAKNLDRAIPLLIKEIEENSIAEIPL
ncbi:MAG: SRPBCC family protein [Planctomycetes bacterium]|nr:SRPBCC family protein [Planctomycetota bacterium]